MSKITSLTDLRSVREYLSRVGAEPRSLKTAVVRENRGAYWKDLAVIRFDKDGSVTVTNEDYAPTEDEAREIKKEWPTIHWPTLKLIPNLVGTVPAQIDKADPAHRLHRITGTG